MSVALKHFIDGVADLTDQHNMRVTIKQSGKGAVLCGATCFVGGILGGPVGLAAGGTIGAFAAAYMTRGSFRSVGDVIRNDLTNEQRISLYNNIERSVQSIQAVDIITLLPLLATSSNIQEAIIRAVISFVVKEMNMSIID